MSAVHINTILGIDIDEDCIKIVELEPVAGNVKINFFTSINTPQDCIKEGIITNPYTVSNIIHNLILKNDIQAKKAILSIRSPYALLRLERLPFMNDEQLNLALQKEINKYTVFRGKEIIFDSNVVEEITEEGVRKINVLYAAATKALCDSYLKTIEQTGLDLLAIDASQLSILRSLKRTNLKAAGLEAIMVVGINLTSIDLSIVKGDKIRFTHTVKLDSGTSIKDVDRFIDKVISALNLVLNFYEAKYAEGEKISKVIFTCDACPSLGFREKWEEKLGRTIPIEIGDPIGDMIIDKDKIPTDRVKELSSYTSAIGSVLHSGNLSSYPFKFNLIPKEKIIKLELTTLMKFLNIILGGALAAFLILGGIIFVYNKSLQFQIHNLKKQVEKPDPRHVKAYSIFDEKNRLERQLEDRIMFIGNVASQVMWDRVFVDAMAKVLEGLWIISIANEESGVRIKGRAYSETPIFNFVNALNNSFYVDEARLVSSQDVRRGDEKREIEFIIVCNLKVTGKK